MREPDNVFLPRPNDGTHWDDHRGPYPDPIHVDRVRGPAGCLFGIGIIALPLLTFAELTIAIDTFGAKARPTTTPMFGFGTLVVVLGMTCAITMIAGALGMLQYRRYGLALAAAYVATFTAVAGCYAILIFPFGIWALVVLHDSDVRREFARRRERDPNEDDYRDPA